MAKCEHSRFKIKNVKKEPLFYIKELGNFDDLPNFHPRLCTDKCREKMKEIIKITYDTYSKVFMDYFEDAKNVKDKPKVPYEQFCELFTYYDYLSNNRVGDKFVPLFMNVGVVNGKTTRLNNNNTNKDIIKDDQAQNKDTHNCFHKNFHLKQLEYCPLEYFDEIFRLDHLPLFNPDLCTDKCRGKMKIIIKVTVDTFTRIFIDYFDDAKIIKDSSNAPIDSLDRCHVFQYYYYLAGSITNGLQVPRYMNVGVVNGKTVRLCNNTNEYLSLPLSEKFNSFYGTDKDK